MIGKQMQKLEEQINLGNVPDGMELDVKTKCHLFPDLQEAMAFITSLEASK